MNRQKISKIFLAGTALALVLTWLYFTPAGLLGKADAVGFAVCHQISSHSYHFGERPLSLCARCTGQFLGMLFGLLYQGSVGWRKSGFPSQKMLMVLGIVMLLYLMDGINSFLSISPFLEKYLLYLPRNDWRLLTGMGLGISLSTILFPLANQVLWQAVDPAPALDGLLDWAGLGGLGGVLVLMIVSENPLLAFPLTLLSTFGVLILLTLTYLLILVILFNRENSFIDFQQLRWWAVAGLTAALLQVSILDALRFLLTGSWSGF